MVVPYKAVVTAKHAQPFRIFFDGDAQCPVKAGDTVAPSSIVLEGRSSSVLQSANVCKELGVSVSNARGFIVRDDGEIIDKGDILARRSVAMGTVDRIIRSQHEGRISLDNIDAGFIEVRAPFSESVVPAGVHGRVAKVLPDRGGHREIEFEVSGYAADAFFCTGGSISGKIFVIKDGTSLYSAGDVDGRCAGCIVLAGRSLSVSLYEALCEVGARGVVIGGMPKTELRAAPPLQIPVFITEGWGIIPVNRVLLRILQEFEGDYAYIDEKKDQLLICPSNPPPELVGSRGSDAALSVSVVSLEKGMLVQVWDMPYWGFSGVVLDVMEEEEMVRIIFDSGKRIVARRQVVTVIGEE